MVAKFFSARDISVLT